MTMQHVASGPSGWRYLSNALLTCVVTKGLATGARLVGRVAQIADDMNHHPDLDVRFGHVVIRSTSHDTGDVTGRDVALAEAINGVLEDEGLDVAPELLGRVEVAMDTRDARAVGAFWSAILGRESEGVHDSVDLQDPLGRLPRLWFRPVPDQGGGASPASTAKNPVRLDVWVPPELAQGRIDGALAAGGSMVDDRYAPGWWVLADPEGNQALLCTGQPPAAR